MLESLRRLDSLLKMDERIVLSGPFEFAFLPSINVLSIIDSYPELSAVFDLRTQGIIGLFDDVDDRLVAADLGLNHLKVYRLSLMDWVVSRLATPKLDDVLHVDGVTLSMLKEIESMFHLYCGVAYNRAMSDLQYLISMKSSAIFAI